MPTKATRLALAVVQGASRRLTALRATPKPALLVGLAQDHVGPSPVLLAPGRVGVFGALLEQRVGDPVVDVFLRCGTFGFASRFPQQDLRSEAAWPGRAKGDDKLLIAALSCRSLPLHLPQRHRLMRHHLMHLLPAHCAPEVRLCISVGLAPCQQCHAPTHTGLT